MVDWRVTALTCVTPLVLLATVARGGGALGAASWASAALIGLVLVLRLWAWRSLLRVEAALRRTPETEGEAG